MEAAVKCKAAIDEWKAKRTPPTAQDIEMARRLLPDPNHPPIDTILNQAANTPLPDSPGGSPGPTRPNSRNGRGKRDVVSVIARRHPRAFEA